MLAVSVAQSSECLDDALIGRLAALPTEAGRNTHILDCWHCRDRLDTALASGRPHGLAPTVQRLGKALIDSDDPSDLAPSTQVGEYVVGEKIGVGGMGAVYAAVHPIIGKKVAIKVIAQHLCQNEDAVARFLREAQAVNAIGHPNIVDVFSIGALPDGRSFLVMELLEGETLADRLKREKFHLRDVIDILDQVLAAVEAAHAKQIIHRDLKPDNVFLVPRPDGGIAVKLLDFGIAKLQDPRSGARATTTGMLLGTPMYMAPEQAKGRAISTAADVYALGGVAFEMLTRRPPFWADNAAEVIAMHLHVAPRPASTYRPQVPAAIDRLVNKMLSKDPTLRPEISEVRSLLRRREAYVPLSQATRRAGRASAKAGRRLAALLGVAALVGATFVLWPGGSHELFASHAPSGASPTPIGSPPIITPVSVGGTLVVVVEPSDAQIQVDGRSVSHSADGARVVFDRDGEHIVFARAAGHIVQRRSVEVSGGTMVHVPVVLARARAFPEREMPRPKVTVPVRLPKATKPAGKTRPQTVPRPKTDPKPKPPLRSDPPNSKKPVNKDAPITDPFSD